MLLLTLTRTNRKRPALSKPLCCSVDSQLALPGFHLPISMPCVPQSMPCVQSSGLMSKQPRAGKC